MPHFNNSNSEWVLDDPNEDWTTYRAHYKTAYLSLTEGSETDWQAHKHTLGRGSVRAARTLFSFAVVLGLAGAIDLFKRRYRRGVISLVLALSACLILFPVWYSREGHYAKEMASASSMLPQALRPELPASAPKTLLRLVAP